MSALRYDPRTLEALTASHGPDRALAIALKQDEQTARDVAAWQRLGHVLHTVGKERR